MSTERKVLFLCAEIFPPPYAFLHKVFNEYLREHGFRFVWIIPSVEATEVEEIDWDGNPVILIPKIMPHDVIEVFQAYLQHLQYLKEVSNLAFEQYGPFHIVQVRDDPAMAYIAWQISRKGKIPFVYQLSHLKEEEVLMYSQMGIYGSKLKNWIMGQIGLAIRNRFLRKADLVFPISDYMKETLAGHGIPSNKMVALPEGVDTSVDPKNFDKKAQDIRKNLGLENKKVIVYVGTMNRFRQLDFLFEVLKHILPQHPRVHLLMVGGGKGPRDLEWLKHRASALGVEGNVTFTGWAPREEVPAYIRASDVGVSPFFPNRVLMNNSPIKLLEYMALEIPLVATDIPEQRKIIEESGGGICVPWDTEKFAGAVKEVLSFIHSERHAMGQRGRAWVKKHRDFCVLAEAVYRAYDGLRVH